jgi:hypothetical protein
MRLDRNKVESILTIITRNDGACVDDISNHIKISKPTVQKYIDAINERVPAQLSYSKLKDGTSSRRILVWRVKLLEGQTVDMLTEIVVNGKYSYKPEDVPAAPKEEKTSTSSDVKETPSLPERTAPPVAVEQYEHAFLRELGKVLSNIKVTLELRGRVSIFFNIQHVTITPKKYPDTSQKEDSNVNVSEGL